MDFAQASGRPIDGHELESPYAYFAFDFPHHNFVEILNSMLLKPIHLQPNNDHRRSNQTKVVWERN